MVPPFMEMMSLSAELEHAARVAAAKRVTAPAMIFLVFIIKMSPFFVNFLIISQKLKTCLNFFYFQINFCHIFAKHEQTITDRNQAGCQMGVIQSRIKELV